MVFISLPRKTAFPNATFEYSWVVRLASYPIKVHFGVLHTSNLIPQFKILQNHSPSVALKWCLLPLFIINIHVTAGEEMPELIHGADMQSEIPGHYLYFHNSKQCVYLLKFVAHGGHTNLWGKEAGGKRCWVGKRTTRSGLQIRER